MAGKEQAGRLPLGLAAGASVLEDLRSNWGGGKSERKTSTQSCSSWCFPVCGVKEREQSPWSWRGSRWGKVLLLFAADVP